MIVPSLHVLAIDGAASSCFKALRATIVILMNVVNSFQETLITEGVQDSHCSPYLLVFLLGDDRISDNVTTVDFNIAPQSMERSLG